MIKGKSGFWLLVIIFSLISMLVVLNGENYGVKISQEMDGTMGQMMKKQHAADKTLLDVFSNENHQSQAMSGQHQLPFFIKSLELGGIATILLLIPLLVGVSVVTIILWI